MFGNNSSLLLRNYEHEDDIGLASNECSLTSEIRKAENLNSYKSHGELLLEPEIKYDVPNCKAALVTGNPFKTACFMNYKQGENPYNAKGNCGLVSISNMLRRGDISISENEITKAAIDGNYCTYSPIGDAKKNGGTSINSRQKLIKKLGIDNEIKFPGNGGDLQDIADAIDRGCGVIISINAGALWNSDDGSTLVRGKLQSNHCVTVTGVARDISSGKIVGIYIADSGRGIVEDACRYLTVEEFHEIYTDVYNSGANITKTPIIGG